MHKKSCGIICFYERLTIIENFIAIDGLISIDSLIIRGHALKTLLILGVLLFSVGGLAQQTVDTTFKPNITRDYFSEGRRPTVLIDAAHNNFHTLNGRYQPFAQVLGAAGFDVQSNLKRFDAKMLADVDILVIANALHKDNLNNWDLPNYSAFTRAEIEAVYDWVRKGGALLLIADHMPFPKASETLAELFGFHFSNGYVEILGHKQQYFERREGSLAQHAITRGLPNEQPVDKVRGFMGQGFLIPPQAQALLSFVKESVSYMPHKSWQIDEQTPTISVTGWHQGATLEIAKGRVVVFGEAGMFTAQISGKEKWKMGLRAKGAEQNEKFLINSILWLARVL